MASQSQRLQRERSYPVLSRREVEGLIADGRKILIMDGFAVKADAWLAYHPGGDKAILHMVGRDATDEVNALHSAEARQMMQRYRIGTVPGRWKNFLPPIQGGVFRPLSADVEKLGGEGGAGASPGTDLPNTRPEECAAESHASSRSASSSPSPLFEAADAVPQSGTRQRHARKEVSRSSSVSSLMSLDEEKIPSDGMAYLDLRTRAEIKLDLDKYPALDEATQDGIVQRYREMNERIKAEGLYQCNYGAYAIEAARYTLLFFLMLGFLHIRWYAVSGFFLGCFWHQLAFTAHDAGHMGITHNFQVDSVIGIFVADFLGGLSIGWWKRNHNVHHIVTNSPEHDPDIEHMPFLAVSHRFLQSLRSTYYDRLMAYDSVAKFAISFQKYLFYPLMGLGRFNLYVMSWDHLLCGRGPRKGPARWHRWLEITSLVLFWIWFGYGIVYKSIPSAWGRFVFFMVSHIVTAPLHVQITLSHFGMSVADLGPDESFPQKMLRTTMDVDCPQWLDFFHGGLQFQAIHHLYPRIPRHNLRRTQRIVQAFCEEVGIPYALYGFVDGNKQVIGRLGDVSRQAAILAKCQKALVNSGDPLHAHHG